MKVHQFFLNNRLRNYNYILYSEMNQQAIVFDPYDSKVIELEGENLGVKIAYLANTHSHPDHIRDNEAVLKFKGVRKLSLKDGEEFSLSENEKIVSRFTPGHVMDHYCYFLYDDQQLKGVICGDTVFNGGIGNCKNGGDPKTLYQTIKKIFMTLPDSVVIYPSHDYFLSNLNFAKTLDPMNENIAKYIAQVEHDRKIGQFSVTTIGEEKLYNPFFRVFDRCFAHQFEMSEQELFLDIRKKRDHW